MSADVCLTMSAVAQFVLTCVVLGVCVQVTNVSANIGLAPSVLANVVLTHYGCGEFCSIRVKQKLCWQSAL